MSIFHVGQKVVCIGQASPAQEQKYKALGAKYPTYKAVYTIRAIVFHSITGDKLLLLDEIKNPVLNEGELERGFSAIYFRPVKETSIEVFRKLLAPLPEKEDA